jgi:hypothetical protein
MSRLFRAGEHPPVFVPYCGLCDLPVERYAYRVPKEDVEAVEFDSMCCGRQQGRRVSLGEMARLSMTGEKFYLIVQKRRFQEIRKAGARA